MQPPPDGMHGVRKHRVLQRRLPEHGAVRQGEEEGGNELRQARGPERKSRGAAAPRAHFARDRGARGGPGLRGAGGAAAAVGAPRGLHLRVVVLVPVHLELYGPIVLLHLLVHHLEQHRLRQVVHDARVLGRVEHVRLQGREQLGYLATAEAVKALRGLSERHLVHGFVRGPRRLQEPAGRGSLGLLGPRRGRGAGPARRARSRARRRHVHGFPRFRGRRVWLPAQLDVQRPGHVLLEVELDHRPAGVAIWQAELHALVEPVKYGAVQVARSVRGDDQHELR
mmetsp:Transcript_99115/g.280471  ORF Transcript_99115/g.280471 Transcript_99115/m.280471 type:complete len:282 (+) Transcript_99115:102-947(+)